MLKFSEILNETLTSNITKTIKGVRTDDNKSIGKRIVYKFKTPKSNTLVAFIFEVDGSNNVSIKFGKIDNQDILTQNVKFNIDDFKFISQTKITCLDDFYKSHSEYKVFIT